MSALFFVAPVYCSWCLRRGMGSKVEEMKPEEAEGNC